MKNVLKKALIATCIAAATLGSVSNLYASEKHEVLSKARQEARDWYQDAKFGVFIHFGAYSLMGGANGDYIADWVMEEERIAIEDYEKLAGNFNPSQFDAKEWAQLFEDAGAQYVTITAKHHDGFSMFDSKVTDYDIVDATPFGRDIMAELKKELDKRDLNILNSLKCKKQLGWSLKKKHILFASDPKRPEKNYRLASKAIEKLDNNYIVHSVSH